MTAPRSAWLMNSEPAVPNKYSISPETPASVAVEARLAGYLVKVLSPRIIGFLVGTLIISLSIYQLIR